MIPSYNKVHLKFKLNGHHYNQDDIKEVAYSLVKEGLSFEQAVGDFLIDWLDTKDFIKVKTTGTTGKPKVIKLKKQSMVNSSIYTGDFFNLKPGDKALHCLPAKFIAGKMMLVRAMILGLEIDLIEPRSIPNFNPNNEYDFCAMLPIQLQNSLDAIGNFKNIIIGSAKASNELIESLQSIPTNIYESFGMTETATHIALRKLNNFDVDKNDSEKTQTVFRTLEGVSVSVDDRGCLVINSPHITGKPVITNDIVKIYSENEFEWLGRFDNVINSGGVKIFPESVEEKLFNKIDSKFFIASEKDAKLGNKVILVIEGDSNDIDSSIFDVLDKYEKPRSIYNLKEFPVNQEKIQRNKILKKLGII